MNFTQSLVIVLFLLTFFDFSVFVPNTSTLVRRIRDTFSKNGKDPSCELCGSVLEGIDLIIYITKPWLKEQVGLKQINFVIEGESYTINRRSFIPPSHCPALHLGESMEDPAVNAHTTCIPILSLTMNILTTYMKNMMNETYGFMAEHHRYFCAYVQERIQYISLMSQQGWNPLLVSASFLPLVPSTSEEKETMVMEYPILSRLTGSRYAHTQYTQIWYLRQPMSLLHWNWCYHFCESRQDTKTRVLLSLWRYLLHHDVHNILYAFRHHYPWAVRTFAVLLYVLSLAVGGRGLFTTAAGAAVQKDGGWARGERQNGHHQARSHAHGMNGNSGLSVANTGSQTLDLSASQRGEHITKRKKR